MSMNVIAQRWPAVARALDEEAATARAEVIVAVVAARGEDPASATLSIDGIQLTSAYDRRAEAELQASRIAEDAREATVYGVGLGDVPRVLLARKAADGRPSLERLTVVVMSPAVARESLTRFDATDWLADPRVTLVLAGPDDAVASPCAVVPPCLRLAAPAAHLLRDALDRALNESFTTARWRERDDELRERIARTSRRFAADADVATVFASVAGGTAFVCGGGPTLSSSFAAIAAARAARETGEPITVIAATTALRPLAQAGIFADYAVVLDPFVTVELHVADLPPEALARTTLVYAPLVDEALLSAWPARRLVYHFDHPLFRAAAAPRTALYAAGTVVHPALDLAVRVGAARVVLCGCDFAYVGARTHADGATVAANVDDARAGRLPVENGRGELVISNPNLIQFLRGTERFLARHPGVTFLNASREGARIRGAGFLEGAS